MRDLQEDLELAVEVAREAGAVVRRFYDEGARVDEKDGGEPVTEADLAANALLVERIAARHPDDALLSEEAAPDERRFERSRVWMIDPLDGTKEFIKRNGEFAVMVGLAVDGRPVVGAVYRPAGSILYAGAVGQGAWMETEGGERVPLRVSDEADPARLRLAVSRSHRPEIVGAICEELGIGQEVKSGSVGLKIGLIATRAADLYLHPSLGTKDWDTCAPEAIVHAAGGRITDAFGDPLRYNEPDVRNRTGIVASNGPLHDRIVAAVAPRCDHLRA